MHRQRSPFTGGPGGFGATPFQFNGPHFGEGASPVFPPAAEGLNGMPFMGKPTIKPMMRSISRQRQLAEDGNGLDSLPPLPLITQRLLSSGGVMGRGQAGKGSFASTAFAPYEGDTSTRSATTQPGTKKSQPYQSVETKNLLQSLRSDGQIADKETDSESEQCMQVHGADLVTETRCSRILDCLLEAVPLQRRQRLRAWFRRCGQSAMARHLMFVLQMLAMLMRGVASLTTRFGPLFTSCRFGIGRTKSQLRSTMRHILWRMASAKGNDTLIFLSMVLGTPWLFLVSLVGLVFSCVISLKTILTEGAHQLRMRLA